MSQLVKLSRWIAKKSARRLMTAGTIGPVSLWQGLSRKVRARVVTYHRFGDSFRDPFCVPLDVFEAQMRWLADTGRAIALTDLQNFVAGKQTIPNNAVLITIDDGSKSMYDHAWPILKHYDLPVVGFISAGIVDGNLDPGLEAEPLISVAELQTLAREGMTIGSHSYHHQSLGQMPLDQAREEAVKSKALLEQVIEQPVTAFAYPFGTRADFSPETRRILQECGYEMVFTTQHGPITSGMDALELPRVKIEGGEGLTMFKMICNGGMDGWGLVDHLLHGTQQVGKTVY